MPKIPSYTLQAGYLETQHREVRCYTYQKYTLVVATDLRCAETKQVRKHWNGKCWRPFRADSLDQKQKEKLAVQLHLNGLWPLDKVACFLMLPYETVNNIVGYTLKPNGASNG